MTIVSPSRANAMRALEKLEGIFAQDLAAGISEHQIGIIRVLMKATVFGLADHFDAGISAEDTLEHFRIAFANVIATFIETFASACNDDDIGALTEEFLEGIWAGAEDALEGDPDVPGEFVTVGNA